MRFSYQWFVLALLLASFSEEVSGQAMLDWELISENNRYEEERAMVSADHGTLYFSRRKHPRNLGAKNAADIWIRNRATDGSWGRPLNAGSPINSSAADFLLGSSADGRRLAILRKGATNYLDIITRGDRSWRIVGSWPVPAIIDASFDLEAQKLVYSQMTVGGQTDLFTQTALPNGEWTMTRPLKGLNTLFDESSPYLAPDGQSLYFRSGNQWWLSRYDAERASFTDKRSLANLVSDQLVQFSLSVVRPDELVGTSTTGNQQTTLVKARMPLSVQPVPSRLLSGKVSTVQSPMDRINGASIRLLVDGRERQLHPDRDGNYVLVVPAEGYARIVADAPGYFAPSRALNAHQELDGGLAMQDGEEQLSDAYYERETRIQKLHRNIAATRQEMDELQVKRQEVNRRIRSEQLAAGREVLAGFSDPELEKLRAQLTRVQTQLRDTIPPNLSVKGDTAGIRKPIDFDELEAMKQRFRAQQESRLKAKGQTYEWRDKQPESLRRDLEKVVTRDLIPGLTHDIVTRTYQETAVDSFALEQNIRQGLYPSYAPAVYERQAWENELIQNLPPETEANLREKLGEPVREGIMAQQAIDETFQQRQADLAVWQDSLDQALSAQLAEEKNVYGRQKQFTAKGAVAAPQTYQAPTRTELELIPLTPGSKMVLGQIQFIPNSASFSPTSLAELNRLVTLMINNPGLKIQIGAHTNSLLSYLAALDLSEQRAAAVVEYLITKGITVDRLQFKGFGRRLPIADQNTPAGRAANQRIELLILD